MAVAVGFVVGLISHALSGRNDISTAAESIVGHRLANTAAEAQPCSPVVAAPQVAPTPPTPMDISTADVLTQLRFKFSKLPALHEIPPQSHVFLTFSNGHYSTLMLNAAALVADLGYPIIVLAFDNFTADTCEQYGLPYMWSNVRMDTVDFRQDRCLLCLPPPP